MSIVSLSQVPPLASIVGDASPGAPRVPRIPPGVPHRDSAVGRTLGGAVLRLLGWRVLGNIPDLPKMILAVAPHTSNWDFVVGFSAYLALDFTANWFGKHTIFVGPFGALFRHFGGIPIRRETSAASQVVDQYAEAFASRRQLVLALAPEGTRKKVAEWKSGFYRIAVRAQVPIVPVGFDFRRRCILIGTPFQPSGDWDAEKGGIRALYAGVAARHPEQA